MADENANGKDDAGGSGGINLNGGGLGEFLKGASQDALQVFTSSGFDKAESPDKFFDMVAASHKELASKVGSALTVPKVDASDEEWSNFTKALRPKEATDYKFELPADLPKETPYDSEFAKSFQTFAHEQGLHPKHASALHDWYVKNFAASHSATMAETQRQVSEAATALHKDWGDPDSPTFKENLSYTQRAIKNLGGETLAKELTRLGAITQNGDVKSPVLIKALGLVGSMLFKEDSFVPNNRGGGVPGGDNPFKEGSVNTTRQGQIIKQDPQLAQQLMKAAGVNPKEYGF
jgi:hypothetical protein